MKSDLATLKQAILGQLKAQFGPLEIVDLILREDSDWDGERVLLIDVIFEGEPKSVDVGLLTGAVRKLRPTLIANGESAFPVLTFVAAREQGALARAV